MHSQHYSYMYMHICTMYTYVDRIKFRKDLFINRHSSTHQRASGNFGEVFNLAIW